MGLAPGQEFGNYRIIDKLGVGGMGSVYLAEHPLIGKKVALKVIHPELSAVKEVVQRFLNEARAVGQIGNEHIVEIHDFGQTDSGEYFYIMEHLAGRTLASLLAEGPMEPARALAIGAMIASGLHAAHCEQVIHRDLKPDNVMLITRMGNPDFVKILDFGLAKLLADDKQLTAVGVVLGTPQYMSPEAAESRGAIDHRADIYTLGILLFQMLTGRVPFDGASMGEILVKQVTKAPPAPRAIRPTIPPSVEQVVLRCLAKRPDDRFADMMLLRAALLDPEAYLASSPPIMPASGAPQQATMFGAPPAPPLSSPGTEGGSLIETLPPGVPAPVDVHGRTGKAAVLGPAPLPLAPPAEQGGPKAPTATGPVKRTMIAQAEAPAGAPPPAADKRTIMVDPSAASGGRPPPAAGGPPPAAAPASRPVHESDKRTIISADAFDGGAPPAVEPPAAAEPAAPGNGAPQTGRSTMMQPGSIPAKPAGGANKTAYMSTGAQVGAPPAMPDMPDMPAPVVPKNRTMMIGTPVGHIGAPPPKRWPVIAFVAGGAFLIGLAVIGFGYPGLFLSDEDEATAAANVATDAGRGADAGPAMAKLSFTSEPSGAEVFDDAGQKLGTTPVSVTMTETATVREFTFKHPKAKPRKKRVRVEGAATVSVLLEMLPDQTDAGGAGGAVAAKDKDKDTDSGQDSGNTASASDDDDAARRKRREERRKRREREKRRKERDKNKDRPKDRDGTLKPSF